MKNRLGIIALFILLFALQTAELFANPDSNKNRILWLECSYSFVQDPSEKLFHQKFIVNLENQTVENWATQKSFEVKKFTKDWIEFSSHFDNNENDKIYENMTINRKDGNFTIETNMFGILYGNGLCKKISEPKSLF